MRYITPDQARELHRRIPLQSGGSSGVRDMNALDSAVAQSYRTYGGVDLYPGIADKAAALCFSIIAGHPFVDGNKRVGHACMEAFLVLNGYEIHASVDEQEEMILGVAAGRVSREQFANWVRDHVARLLMA